jgi:hypothetical protein
MTVSTAETVTVDGFVLNTYAYNISTLSGRLSGPTVRTKNVEIPGKHGTLRVRNKKFQEGMFTLTMWVKGALPDGSIPSQKISRRLFYENVDMLMQIFSRRTGLLNIQQVMPDGSVRQCFGEVLAIVDPASTSSNPLAKFNVAMTLPDVFWSDLNPVTYTSPVGLPVSEVLTLTPFIGATAPMEDLQITVTGLCSQFKIQALENGQPLEVDCWVNYNASVGSTSTLTLNSGGWTLGHSGGSTPSVGNVTHSGSAFWMSLPPGPQNTAPQVKWTCANPDSHTQVSITGSRKYVVV